MKHILLLCITALGFSSLAYGQSKETVSIAGQQYPYIVDDCGDTLIVATLDDVSISTMREFKSREDYLRYRRYRRYAAKVYP
ncbi:MAG: DUF4294 domain-containing protein, partial [Phaeodactylibacter sp.]|nr:DUF4294 domain-containing protein [Phaeodactylibacter sp.]